MEQSLWSSPEHPLSMGCLGLLHKLHHGAAPQKTRVLGALTTPLFFLELSAWSWNHLVKKRGAEQSQTTPLMLNWKQPRLSFLLMMPLLPFVLVFQGFFILEIQAGAMLRI